MVRSHWYSLLLVFCICLACWGQVDQPLGLKFASDEQLAGIPLASTPFSGAELPSSVDLSRNMPPPGSQGHQQSCVAWTLAYALKSYQEFQEERKPYTGPGGRIDSTRLFSPAFIYNQINQGRDGGALFIDGLNVLSNQGAATLADMPYNELDFTTRPSQIVRENAKRYRIDYWRRVNTQDLKEVKAQLNAGYPVIIGAIVDDGFMALRQNGIWRSLQGQQRGGHAMLVVGYDDDKGAFKLINSWGQEWGDRGFGWIAYIFFNRVVREGYVVKDAINSPVFNPNPNPGPDPAPTPPIDPAATIRFNVTNMQHNVPVYGVGPGMQLMGNLSVPPGVRGRLQVVIYIHANDGRGGPGMPIGALAAQFATPQGQAATVTPPIMISEAGITTNWFSAVIPYQVLNVPKGLPYTPPRRSDLVAVPVLFIDNFGVRIFPPIPFFVVL